MSGDDSSCDEDKIIKISRKRLSGLTFVGEGAFGAVYKGKDMKIACL
jgi:hypothetical protein